MPPSPPISKPRLGQHFLTSHEYLDRMIEAIRPASGDRFLEIGPGKGALTSLLLEAELIVAIEKDQGLAAQVEGALAEHSHLVVYRDDFLQFSFSELERHGKGRWRVVGNLPYYAATQILQRLVGDRQRWLEIWATVQREVADRICAKPRSKPYGFFSLFCQYYTEPTRLFDIPPKAFTPPPEVHSTFLCLQIRSEKAPLDDEAFFELLRKVFAHRRKTIRKNLELAGISPDLLGEIFRKQQIDPMARPQELSLDDFLVFFQSLYTAK